MQKLGLCWCHQYSSDFSLRARINPNRAGFCWNESCGQSEPWTVKSLCKWMREYLPWMTGSCSLFSLTTDGDIDLWFEQCGMKSLEREKKENGGWNTCILTFLIRDKLKQIHTFQYSYHHTFKHTRQMFHILNAVWLTILEREVTLHQLRPHESKVR